MRLLHRRLLIGAIALLLLAVPLVGACGRGTSGSVSVSGWYISESDPTSYLILKCDRDSNSGSFYAVLGENSYTSIWHVSGNELMLADGLFGSGLEVWRVEGGTLRDPGGGIWVRK